MRHGDRRAPVACLSYCEVLEDCIVSIVRIGLGETKNFGEGYEAIFGKAKKEPAKTPTAKKAAAKSAKKVTKKKAAKKK